MITFDVNIFNTSFVYTDDYHDGATFEADIANGVVSVPTSSIVNQAPTVDPPHGGSADGTTAKWTPDGIGVTDLVSGYGAVGDTTLGRKYVGIILFNSPKTILPTWVVTDPNGNESTIKGTTAAFPDAFAFLYDTATATMIEMIDPYKGTAREGILTATIKKLP